MDQFHRLPAMTCSYFIPTLRAHIWQTRCWQIYPSHQHGNLIDSCSLRAHIQADQVLADLPPSSYGNFTDCCSDTSYFIPTLRAHIWQTTPHIKLQCWQRPRSPSLYGNFTDCCSDTSYFIPTLRTHIWQTKCWQIYPQPPTSNGNDRFLV